jgi:hypothetical protein
METQAFKHKEEKTREEKTREEERQRRICDMCRDATKPEYIMNRLGELVASLKIAGQTQTQVYKNSLEAIIGLEKLSKKLSDTIYAKSEKVPSASEIAENLRDAISGLSGTKSETEGKA